MKFGDRFWLSLGYGCSQTSTLFYLLSYILTLRDTKEINFAQEILKVFLSTKWFLELDYQLYSKGENRDVISYYPIPDTQGWLPLCMVSWAHMNWTCTPSSFGDVPLKIRNWQDSFFSRLPQTQQCLGKPRYCTCKQRSSDPKPTILFWKPNNTWPY